MSNPHYLIAQIDVKDYDSYLAEYAMPLMEILSDVGAEVLAADANARALEGEWPGNWTVIIKFPSKDAMTAFYQSERYAPLKDLRINKLSDAGSVASVAGFSSVAAQTGNS